MNNNSLIQQALMREVGLTLDEEDIRPSDNFIELGGNSFLAIQVALNLKNKEGIEVNVAELLGNPLEKVFVKVTETQARSYQ